MKVICIIDSIDLYGKERANIEVARVLKKHGYDVTVVINARALLSVREELYDFDTIDVTFPRNIEGKHRIWHYIVAFYKANREFRKILQRLNPHYVLLPTEIAIAYLYPSFRNSDAKIVFRCGDSPLVFRKKSVTATIYGWLWKNILIKRVDKLVCNAKFIQNQIKDSGRTYNPEDALIYNYPPERISVDDGIEYKQTVGALRVGFMGRIVCDKGVSELVEAILECNKKGYKTIAYIGGNPNVDPKYTSRIKQILKDNPQYASCIQFVGNVKNIDAFYDNVDVMAIPSIYPEPMANVLTEAKMHHCLSIIYNLGGMPEIVEHKKTGFICDEVSVKNLTESFIYYNENKEEIYKQGEAAFKSIAYLNLDYDCFVNHWLYVFK